MNKIIALWTHPRSISTAFERVMMERGDFGVIHEPFSYLYYVQQNIGSIPQEYIDHDHPKTYPDIKSMIFAEAKHQAVFFKDMCAHCCDHLIADEPFLKNMVNTFLIRDPAKAIPSYYAMNPGVKRDEIGYEQVLKVFEKVNGVAEERATVIDADDLEDDPEGVVKAYCDETKIPFLPESLHWEPGASKKWKIWGRWHEDAARSTGIEKNLETFEVTVENDVHLKSYYDYHFPFYLKMYNHRIKTVEQDSMIDDT